MDIMQLGAQLFQSQLDKDHDGQVEMTEIAGALMGLMSGSQQEQSPASGLNGLASMITGMQQGGGDTGLASLASSWLGQGSNEQPSSSQITQMFGQDKISAFAQQLGISQDQAVNGLRAAVPDMVDKASPNGSLDVSSLLDSVGGVSGAIGLAGKLFGR